MRFAALAVLILALQAPASAQQPAGRGRATPPQPQQKQGVEYFIGTWAFAWTGRESPLTAGPRAGTITLTRKGTTDTLEIAAEGKVEDTGARFEERGSADWNDAQKTLTMHETLANGSQVTGIGDWSSPLSIRYESKPVQVAGQSIRIRRVYSILSAHSFAVTEEMSIDGGAFQRLGNGVFSRK
jgi:hypothetical protein